MLQHSDLHSPLEIDGRLWLRGALDEAALAPLDTACSMSGRPGFAMHGAAALAAAIQPGSPLSRLVATIAVGQRPVRAVAVNGARRDTWDQPWHQDREVLMREKHDVDGFTNWSLKSGIWHVDAPREMLERMIGVKIFLTDSEEGDSASEIALGSHLQGLIAPRDATAAAMSLPREALRVRRGDVLVMKMLTLHRSRSGPHDGPRRSFRIDYAGFAPPPPLQWAM